ncbi:HK97-gp10 family putative phage morphogenesis protein [Bosea sp. RCC_152_1]|uniref:HK97-gp10 family putative phage morphogenesis protein n=1 Tax=Bosea sp. RCC_152_1 TaxID=3239228 RepID=UPI0035255943
MSDNGLADLKRRIDAVIANVRSTVDPALKRSADEIADVQRSLAERSRDSGALIESIAVTMGPGQTPPYSQPGGSHTVPEHSVAITAGNSEVRYPHLVEYGAAHAAAQPFFWPGFRLMRRRAQERIKRSVSKAVRDGWNS